MKRIFILLVFVFCAILFATGQPNPVAYYPFNGNANDAGSNGINGILYGSPLSTTNNMGVANSAYEFDGIDDYIDLGSNILLKPSTRVSLALWAYSANWSSFSSWAALAGNTSSGGYELIVNGSAGNLEAECRRNGSYGIASYPLSSLSAGWHHIAFTFDGRYTILFIDGDSVDTDDAGAIYSVQYAYPGNSTIIGDEAGSGATPEGDRFTGKIDEVRFYDVALTSSEILSLFNASASVYNNDEVSISFNIYPNPASGFIVISGLNVNKQYIIVLTDMSGKTILKTTAQHTNGRLVIDKPANLSSGLFQLTAEDENGFKLFKKIVIL